MQLSKITSLSACLFSLFAQSNVVAKLGLKNSYILGMCTFGLSMIVCVLVPNPWVVLACNAISGLGKEAFLRTTAAYDQE